jgi:dUTP pyrophosphatase
MFKLPVKIKKLSENAVIPFYATNGSAGMDLTATSEKITHENGVPYIEYGTGLAVELPPGFCALLLPRSSISSTTTLVLANSVGLLDSDFRGEIKFRFKTLTSIGSKKYKIGDRIGQLLIIPYPSIQLEVVSDLSDTARGAGSYGSTNK